jgi:hypothetical protein
VTGEATWHRLEHSGYTADLPIWSNLASRWGPDVAEVGAGCGRITVHLAKQGFRVTAFERSRELAHALRAAVPPDLTINVIQSEIGIDSTPCPPSSLVIFPLLVCDLICAQVGLMTGLDQIASFVPASSRAAFAVRPSTSSGAAAFPLPLPPAEVPFSRVSRVAGDGSDLELEHTRLDRSGASTRIERMARVSVDQIALALDRDPIEKFKVPATSLAEEGLVVLF